MNTLFVASRGGVEPDIRWGPVGRLEHLGDRYRFVYTRGARSLEGFHPLPGMPDLDQVYESAELFPVFANRLLARSRPEYEAFLTWGGFDPDNPPDPIMILGVTEGRRATDALELFPCPQPDGYGGYINKFFLHGVQRMPPESLRRIGSLQRGEELALRAEPKNKFDSNAVAVFASGPGGAVRIGYVPRYLAADVHKLGGACPIDTMGLVVERLNNDAPLQQRVLCRMDGCWPENFCPCSEEDYQPIVGSLAPTIA